MSGDRSTPPAAFNALWIPRRGEERADARVTEAGTSRLALEGPRALRASAAGRCTQRKFSIIIKSPLSGMSSPLT